MTDYEINKQKIAEHRERSKGKRILNKLCDLMEFVNEKYIKEIEDEK